MSLGVYVCISEIRAKVKCVSMFFSSLWRDCVIMWFSVFHVLKDVEKTHTFTNVCVSLCLCVYISWRTLTT